LLYTFVLEEESSIAEGARDQWGGQLDVCNQSFFRVGKRNQVVRLISRIHLEQVQAGSRAYLSRQCLELLVPRNFYASSIFLSKVTEFSSDGWVRGESELKREDKGLHFDTTNGKATELGQSHSANRSVHFKFFTCDRLGRDVCTEKRHISREGGLKEVEASRRLE